MTAPRIPLVEVGADPALAGIEARILAARGRVSPLYRELAERFGPTELVELVATVAAYNRVSRFLVALRVGH